MPESTTFELLPSGAVEEVTRQLAPVIRPRTQELLQKVQSDINDAEALVIDSAFMAQIAQESNGRLATVESEVDTERLERGKPLRDAQKWLNDGFSQALGSIAGARAMYTAKLLKWNRDERERERKAAEAAEALRREEAQAAAQREAAALAEADRIALEASALQESAPSVAGAMVASAQIAADQARTAAAAAAVRVLAPLPLAVGSGVKGAGETWKARVTNKKEGIIAIAKQLMAGDESNIDLLHFNESNLNKKAALEKNHLNLPGITAYPDETLRTRKRAV